MLFNATACSSICCSLVTVAATMAATAQDLAPSRLEGRVSDPHRPALVQLHRTDVRLGQDPIHTRLGAC
jgi:hypothetical protein